MPDGENLVGDSFKFDPTYHHISDYLGVDPYDREDISTANKVNVIREMRAVEVARQLLATSDQQLVIKTNRFYFVKIEPRLVGFWEIFEFDSKSFLK